MVFQKGSTRMKKLSVALVLVLASLALVACGGSSGTTTTPEAPTAPAETESSESGGAAPEGEEEGGGKEEGASGGSTVNFEANPEGMLMFEEKSVTAKAGTDTIDFKNPASIPHSVAIEDSGGKQIAETETISEGETTTTAKLEPGTYTFYCTVPGHRQAGMEGTLTVK